jgi:hypothetical protein
MPSAFARVPSAMSHRPTTRFAVRVVAAVAVIVASVPAARTAQAQAPPAGGLVEVGRLPVPGNPPASGWLVLNPTTRRAYELFEEGTKTTVQSFDLDTLAPLRRLELDGILVPHGRRDGHISAGQTLRSGEVAHALDEQAGILYLALGAVDAANTTAHGATGSGSTNADARKFANRYVAIDEKALDEGRPAVASFREPEAHARLGRYWLMGMAVDRHRLSESSVLPGRKVGNLVLLFAQPNHPNAPVHNHELVRWDVGPGQVLHADAADPMSNGLTDPFATPNGGQVLDACRFGTVSGGFGFNANGSAFQWELLVRRHDILFVCQSAPSSAAVARMELRDGGAIPPTGGVTLYLLGRGVFDAVTDGVGKLFLRSTTDDGETWWVFDADTRRFTGSLAAKTSANGSMSIGVDHSTGRLYMLLTDYTSPFGGKQTPVRGGLLFADTRLSAPVPFENVRPDLAYPAHMRIQVDPVTRRVFVRRGHQGELSCVVYPATDGTSKCPLEGFYRVFKDTIPIPQEQPAVDDAAFTTDVAEKEGVTQASYLGTGSGYGARTLLVGGVTAASSGVVTQSPCGKDDRRVLVGSVGNVSVSDISTAASAASLDADIGTQKVSATPGQSCVPSFPVAADSDEFSFDKRNNKDPSVEVPDGINDYEASCTGDGTDKPPTVAGVGRQGFSSEAVCDRKGSRGEGRATGRLTLPEDAAGISVAKGHSEARIVRRTGEGITATVDSWARGIVIPNVGEIGAVRAEATVQAAGRPGSAKARFERTICDVDLGDFQHLGCLDLEKDGAIDKLNEAATGRAEFRLREVDPELERGSRSGYQAGIQRDRLDGFEDRALARDDSLAVPALEVVYYPYGSGGRVIVQLAGAQATVSYGIACLEGQGRDGKCADGLDEDDLSDELLPDDAGDIAAFDDTGDSDSDDLVFADDGTEALGPFAPGRGESAVTRFLRAPVRAVAAALRLLFNNPRELGLMTAVWVLLYGPFRLAGRHRSIRSLRRRRLAPT